MNIGNLIDKIREKRGMSKAELARRLEVSRPTVDRIIHGGKCDLQLLLRLEEILDYPFTKDTSKMSEADLQYSSNLVFEPHNMDSTYGELIKERQKRIFYQKRCYEMADEIEVYKKRLKKDLNHQG